SILRNRHSTSCHAKTRNHYLVTDKPMRALFFRDHEISGLRQAAAPSPVGVPESQAKTSSTSNP
ncbi:MAG: hypothetical protein ACXVW7_19175, partial [Trebonia sp.]